MVENLSYVQAVARLASEFGVNASTGAVRRFFEWITDKRVIDRAVEVHARTYADYLSDSYKAVAERLNHGIALPRKNSSRRRVRS